MIFWTWRSYFIHWQIFENKVWCPVSKKRTKYFHFLLSLAYPIDRLDWALFSVVILFHHFFPLLEKVEIRVFILPRNFPAVLIIFTGRGGAGNPPLPTARGGAGNPPFPAGRVPRGTGRPSLIRMIRVIMMTRIFKMISMIKMMTLIIKMIRMIRHWRVQRQDRALWLDDQTFLRSTRI